MIEPRGRRANGAADEQPIDRAINRLLIAESIALLPDVLSQLSVSRSQMVLDQLRAAIGGTSDDDLIAVPIVKDVSGKPAAAALASSPRGSDVANLLYCGVTESFQGLDEASQFSVVHQVVQSLEEALRRREVRFLQWAIDATHPLDLCDHDDREQDGGPQYRPGSVQGFASAMKMRQLACLEYLSIDLPGTDRLPAVDLQPAGHGAAGRASRADGAPLVTLRQLEGDQSAWNDFADLVSATYQQTLDCPALTSHRSAHQILEGYTRACSYRPGWWFRVEGVCNGSRRVVGCLLLAYHEAASELDDTDPVHKTGPVAELVYMGVAPEARGLGWGRRILAAALGVAEAEGASRMILAVDEANLPARNIYRQAGFRSLMRETVLAKSWDL